MAVVIAKNTMIIRTIFSLANTEIVPRMMPATAAQEVAASAAGVDEVIGVARAGAPGVEGATTVLIPTEVPIPIEVPFPTEVEGALTVVLPV